MQQPRVPFHQFYRASLLEFLPPASGAAANPTARRADPRGFILGWNVGLVVEFTKAVFAVFLSARLFLAVQARSAICEVLKQSSRLALVTG